MSPLPIRPIARRMTASRVLSAQRGRRPAARAVRRFQAPAARFARPRAAQSGKPDQVVDLDRRRAEQRDDADALVGARLRDRHRRLRPARLPGRRSCWPRIGRKTPMTSSAAVTSVAPCLSRPLVPSARGSSGEPGTAKTSRPCSPASRAVIRRAGAARRLDDDDAERKPGNQAVAAWKIPRARLPCRTAFRRWPRHVRGSLRADRGARAGRYASCRRRAPRRCRSPGSPVRRRVDAARQSGDDDEAGFAEIARDRICEFRAGGGGVARADDGDHRQIAGRSALSAHGDQRRRRRRSCAGARG